MSADWSAKPVPVPYADFRDPQTLNLYGFVGGNPASKVDADGHLHVPGVPMPPPPPPPLILPPPRPLIQPITPPLPALPAQTPATIQPGAPASTTTKPTTATPPSTSTTVKPPTAHPASRSNPFTGKPDGTVTLKNPDGTPKQVRTYGPDGYPKVDVDYGHDHTGVGDPHAHDWGRPTSGGPPTNVDRGAPRPVTPNDPKPN